MEACWTCYQCFILTWKVRGGKNTSSAFARVRPATPPPQMRMRNSRSSFAMVICLSCDKRGNTQEYGSVQVR